MNAITSDNNNFSPIHQLAVAVTTITKTTTLDQLIKHFNSTTGYQPSTTEIKSILSLINTNSTLFLSSQIHLETIYTVYLQVLFATANKTSTTTTTTTTTTTATDILAEFLPQVATQLSTEPTLFPEIKLSLLEFCLGNLLPTSGLCYDIIQSLLTLLTQSQLPTMTIDHIISLIPENVQQWGLQPMTISQLYKLTYDYAIRTSTPFSSRQLLSAAMNQFQYCDVTLLTQQLPFVTNVVNDFFTLTFSLPSHQVCLDEFLAYATIIKHQFITTSFFTTQFPTFQQLLVAFNTINTISNAETFITQPIMNELTTKYGLNTELIRTNLISLIVAEKIQAGKGFRFTTLQNYLQLSTLLEVEEYIVEATTHGQISTKIDEIQQIVYVSRVVPRKFDAEKSWIDIQRRLAHVDKILQQFAPKPQTTTV